MPNIFSNGEYFFANLSGNQLHKTQDWLVIWTGLDYNINSHNNQRYLNKFQNKMVREPNVSPHKQIIKDDDVKECISIEYKVENQKVSFFTFTIM